MKCEIEFKKLDAQTNFVKKVEPLYYTGKLLLGIVCVFLSINWMALIAYTLISTYLFEINTGDKSNLLMKTSDYIDSVMGYFVEKDLDYVSNVIFISMALYLLAVTIKGNSTLGFRFASPLFYPMRENETQMNAFVFNVLLLNACSLGITEYCSVKFPSYTRGKTYIYNITMIFEYSDFMFWIIENHLIKLTMLSMSALVFLLNITTGGYRIKFSDLEKKYRKNAADSSLVRQKSKDNYKIN